MKNRYLLFFSLWLVAQFTLLCLASSKRTVYLMSLTPAAAVLATEYAAVLYERLRLRAAGEGFLGVVGRQRRGLAIGVLTLVVGSYLAAAQWAAPRADRQLSFVPLISEIQTLQAAGQQVALYQANERAAGASVFYTRSLLKDVQTEAQLNAFLGTSPNNVAVMALQEDPKPPLKVLKKVTVSRQAYYFVSH